MAARRTTWPVTSRDTEWTKEDLARCQMVLRTENVNISRTEWARLCRGFSLGGDANEDTGRTYLDHDDNGPGELLPALEPEYAAGIPQAIVSLSINKILRGRLKDDALRACAVYLGLRQVDDGQPAVPDAALGVAVSEALHGRVKRAERVGP